MQFVVKLDSFSKAFRQVSVAVPTHSTKDSLKHVKVQATTNAVSLIGSNGVVEMIVQVSDVVRSDAFEMFLPTARLLMILSEIDGEQISFEFETGAVWIRGEGRRWEFRLQTIDGEDFARLKVDKPGCVYTLNAENVQNMIKRTVFAADSDSHQYVLDGVRCEFEGHEVNFVATDTRRLAIAHGVCTVEGGAVDQRVIIGPPVIPQKAMKIIASIMTIGETATFSFVENQVSVKCGLCEVVATVLGGKFPDWRRVVPQSMPINIALIAGAFASAVRQSKLMKQKDDDDKAIKIEVRKGKLRLMSAVNQGAMDSKVDVQVAYDGEPLDVFFDPEYLLDFLKSLESMKEITLKLEYSDSMALIECGEYRYAIMPLDRSATVETKKKK